MWNCFRKKKYNYIKLNTNENPLGPSTHVKNAILKVLKTNGTELRLYPEPESQSLKKVISQHYKVSNNQIFVGNGSDEVLAFCFQALLANRGNLAIPEITYSFYPSLAKLFAINIVTSIFTTSSPSRHYMIRILHFSYTI